MAFQQGWLTNTVDADAIIDQLFEGCFAAGPTRCALARSGDKSASSIGDRLWGWIGALDAAPVSGLSYAGSSIVMTGADIRRIMGSAAYSPLVAFRPLAQLLDDAMRGTNLAALLSAIETGSYGGPLQNACPVAPPPDGSSSGKLEQGSDGTTSVVCGDGADVTGKNLTWWQSYQAQQLARSSVLGEFWTTIRLPCARWRLRANWVFRGPYTTPEPSRRGDAPQKGRPAAPLLFLTNRLDPVTPLRAARAMAAQHPGAKVVVQETMGHCAFASAYSPCTKDAVAEYFDTGTLPDEEEASCPVECGPWNASTACSGAVVAAREPWHVRRFPLGI